MRLQKYMALCGVASRRSCEKIIAEGRVSVNGKIVDTPGLQVCDDDDVRLDGKVIRPEQYEYKLFYKPVGVVSTLADKHAERTVSDYIKSDNRLYCVGRLDADTEGLMILTNDGDLTFALTHPSHELEKTYRALVKGRLTGSDAAMLEKGVVIDVDGESYTTLPASVRIQKHKRGATLVIIKIREGKKRQVRKMCAAVGHPVIALKRIAIGDLTDDSLKPGAMRDLSAEEIMYLKQC